MTWQGRVALVTGGASGIGAATAEAFASRGADVVVADIDEHGAERTATAIGAHGVRADVVCEESVRAMVAAVQQRFGRLDFAVNNAGVEQQRARVTDCTEENWDRTVDTNLKGVWLSMKHEIPLLAEVGGAIVNMSSMVGLVGVPGAPAYVASKHGIVGLTKAAALEVADQGIRVNACCPGNVMTPMVERVIAKEPQKRAEYEQNTPLGRIATPEEVARTVVWLCSDDASFVTGHALSVDGGVVAT